MKVKFSRSVMYVPKWNGNADLPEEQQVKVKLRPLKMDDFIKLMDSLQDSAGQTDVASLVKDGKPSNISQIKNLVEACGHIIPLYCEIIGLEDESGPVSSKELVQYTWYLDLAAELLTELGSISMPRGVEEKNLNPQPGSPDTLTQ